ncbi:lipopolysaccharide biosynthesis protein [Pectobacterium sp. B2J-2]|uniref:lipopolysaccharide biosynthesis protein n=1 Tax=Pectobacterium sp. B2J-2 TaxID=3385372 RepID=UPI0038FC8BCD
MLFTKQNIWKMFLYFVLPLLSAIIPFIVYPTITALYGNKVIIAIGIAQSIGTAGAVIGELGWGVIGPQLVAGLNDNERKLWYGKSLSSRLISSVFCIFIATLVCFLLVDDFLLSAIVMAIAITCGGLLPNWYLIGLNKPEYILYYIVIPKLILCGISIFLIKFYGGLIFYSLAMLFSFFISMMLLSYFLKVPLIPGKKDFNELTLLFKDHYQLVFGRVISTFYTALPITLIGFVNPAAVATFTGIERLFRMALSVLSGFPSRLQSWIGTAPADARAKRIKLSIIINLGVGLFSMVGFTIACYFISPYIYSNTINISLEYSLLAGVVVAIICTSRGYGLALVAMGVSKKISIANIASAIVGVSAICILGYYYGVWGGLLGEVLAEVAGLLTQLYYYNKYVKDLKLRSC